MATRNNKNVVSISGKNQLKIILPDTGRMDIFREVVIGELKLQKGLNTITFTGGKKDEIWDFVRLKRIVLKKVN